MEDETFKRWYDECIGMNYGNVISSQPNNAVSKDYIDNNFDIDAPISCNHNQITFSIKENKKLVIKDDGIYWYNEKGEEFKIYNSDDLAIALEAVIKSYFDYDTKELMKKLKKQAFDEMIADIGIENERFLKLSKIFNEKN
jgi:hypothetical protein